MSAQVLETIACYPENMEAKELRRILTQPHFMVGSSSTTSTPNSQRDPCCVECGLIGVCYCDPVCQTPGLYGQSTESCLAPELGEAPVGDSRMQRKRRTERVIRRSAVNLNTVWLRF